MGKWSPFLAGALHEFTNARYPDTHHDNTLADIELAEKLRIPRRVDSGTSFCILGTEQKDETSIAPCHKSYLCEPMYLTLGSEDAVHAKLLDYRTFAQWDAMEALAEDLDKDGFRVEGLCDTIEEMEVSSGDWDARAHPGWKIRASFIMTPNWNKRRQYEDDDDSDTESYGTASQEGWRNDYIDEYLDEQVEDWCLLRWRSRVEREIKEERSQDPSWTVLMLGFALMAFFIVAVTVYTA